MSGISLDHSSASNSVVEYVFMYKVLRTEYHCSSCRPWWTAEPVIIMEYSVLIDPLREKCTLTLPHCVPSDWALGQPQEFVTCVAILRTYILIASTAAEELAFFTGIIRLGPGATLDCWM